MSLQEATRMVEQNTEMKLKNLLKQDKIQLWNPPYTEDNNQPGLQHMQELSQRYAALLALPPPEVSAALESVRVQAVRRGKGNRAFRETSVATLELLLPRGSRKESGEKTLVETRLDAPAQQLVDRIGEEFNLKHIKLIVNGKTLSVGQRLDEQEVKNNSKVMVLKLSDAEWKQQLSQEEEKRRRQEESLQRTHKGFQILSEREGYDDPETTPFLEIADQKGNPLKIPHKEKKALILAMGFHEKGRSLMKKQQYDDALIHLLQADQHFNQCGSALLSSVDNSAVLQLDIVWCYRALEALSCLQDAAGRLSRAESVFLQCYGAERERLRMLKGNTGREEVLFLRLYLLQSLLSYIEGNDRKALQLLSSVESLYSRLSLDSGKVAQLLDLGFTEREARLGLRASQGDLGGAAEHISTRREEQQQLKQQEAQRRRRRMEAISALTELGFSRRDAARALEQAGGDADSAYSILVESSRLSNNNQQEALSPHKVEQLLSLGFLRSSSEAALSVTGGNVEEATQLLLDHGGVVPPQLLGASSPGVSSSSSSSPSCEEPASSSSSSSSSSAPSPAEEAQLVKEVLEDLPPHEEDHLDLTLEEEAQLIASLRGFLRPAGTPPSA
ncbi:NEDD8 ultimate buster 1 [Salarias fasciatus]|uniref:UBA domain-containing protein n=1 Tax=Salarias fasciatus TaxID=181472 RepID=A0A672GES5_SALFA|nr:NEDD8 ultimate buster 1 [Salarias fasciatus]